MPGDRHRRALIVQQTFLAGCPHRRASGVPGWSPALPGTPLGPPRSSVAGKGHPSQRIRQIAADSPCLSEDLIPANAVPANAPEIASPMLIHRRHAGRSASPSPRCSANLSGRLSPSLSQRCAGLEPGAPRNPPGTATLQRGRQGTSIAADSPCLSEDLIPANAIPANAIPANAPEIASPTLIHRRHAGRSASPSPRCSANLSGRLSPSLSQRCAGLEPGAPRNPPGTATLQRGRQGTRLVLNSRHIAVGPRAGKSRQSSNTAHHPVPVRR
jgi:hypothetical protein